MQPGLYLMVVADSNDADYVHSFQPITPELLEKFKPLITAIKDFKPYKTKTEDRQMDWTHSNNYPWGECCRKDLGEKSYRDIYAGVVDEETLELFDESFVPHTEYGIHTIESIEVIEVSKAEKLL